MAITGEHVDADRTGEDGRSESAGEAPATVAPGPRLEHEPALDGLRGLAVLVVVLFHLGRLDGGFMGVDLFFALSGFLITSLLLVERVQRGRIDLGRFWLRRARRLLPALFLVLVGIAVLLILFTPADQRPLFRGDALATLAYVANWHSLGADSSYWDMFNQPSPLDHAWSLAIEEQFYVLWPLVVVAAGAVGAVAVRRRVRPAAARAGGDGVAGSEGAEPSPALPVGVVALAGAVVSFALLAWLYDPLDTNRAYFGTDTRIGPTLLGAALAAFALGRPRREARPAWWVDVLGGLALAWMAWTLLTTDGLHSWYYRGGLVGFSLAALVVMVTVTGGPPGVVGRAMSVAPLRALGVISYGVYLWHWPVIVYLDPEQRAWLSVDGVTLDVLRVVISLAAAVASYVLVERPIRHGALRGRVLAGAGAGALAVTLLAVVLVTSGEAQEQIDMDSPRETVLPDLAAFPEGAPRVMLLGDSGVIALGPELREHGAGRDVAVGTSSDPVCTAVYPEGVVLHNNGEVGDNGLCQDERRDEWLAAVTDLRPDVVTLYLANAGMVEYRLDGRWVDDCDPAYQDHLRESLGTEIEGLSATGARVVLLTSPYIGTLDETSGPRTDCRNAFYRDLAAATPGTEVLDLNGFVEEASAEHGADWMFADWVHLSPEGGQLVSEWLLPQLLE